jgi:hypothetical protein
MLPDDCCLPACLQNPQKIIECFQQLGCSATPKKESLKSLLELPVSSPHLGAADVARSSNQRGLQMRLYGRWHKGHRRCGNSAYAPRVVKVAGLRAAQSFKGQKAMVERKRRKHDDKRYS